MIEFNHKPVMLKEVIEYLNIKSDGIYVDGTLGGAGHSIEIAKKLSNKGTLIGIDRDIEALNVAKKRLSTFKNIELVHDNHDNIKNILKDLKINSVDGILLDLGVSSYQLDEKIRGFSYLGSNDLDMRMDQNQDLTAKKVVNEYSEEDLSRIFFDYGEEKFAKKIAKNIVKARNIKEICKTDELVKIIEESIPKSKQHNGHPAKKVFQAIRIEVNNEIKPLYNTIMDCIDCLKDNGRLCVITFHSLEDRACKEAMQDAEGKCTCPKDLPYCVCNYISKGKVINKKPIISEKEELNDNSRAKSAKLRVFEAKSSVNER